MVWDPRPHPKPSTMSDHSKYMTVLKLDDAEIQSRRAFFKLTDEDLERAMRLAEEHVTLTASGGRVEKLRARLDSQRASAASGAK